MQQAEQGIVSAGHALHPQPRGDAEAQFSRAQTRQLGADGPHVRQHGLGPFGRDYLALTALVELPAGLLP